jgi:hypothetical protein
MVKIRRARIFDGDVSLGGVEYSEDPVRFQPLGAEGGGRPFPRRPNSAEAIMAMEPLTQSGQWDLSWNCHLRPTG